MTTHLSVRLAWHDRGWDARICDAPNLNTSCIVHEHIRDTRDDEKELKAVYDQIDTLERSRIKSAEHTFFEHYFQYAVAGALLIVLWLGWRARVKG